MTPKEKCAARRAVRYAVTKGLLVPVRTLKCRDCGGPATEYDHHLGHENALAVESVCRKCHKRREISRGTVRPGWTPCKNPRHKSQIQRRYPTGYIGWTCLGCIRVCARRKKHSPSRTKSTGDWFMRGLVGGRPTWVSNTGRRAAEYRMLDVPKTRPDTHGEQNPNAKLNIGQVQEIRKLRKEGLTLVKLADMFGVANPHISLICRGKCWREL